MKLDRLITRIRAALQNYAPEFEQRALAEEYTGWCAKATQRLEQVVPLIREGQDFPALQIAESPPSVLDLIRQLSFAEADLWRAFCRQRNLPTAPPFDERNVHLVNQLYAKKISETHPLYREYRQAVRLRHEDQALRVLQSIRRINHDDANAHAEFTRLAHKTFVRRRDELARALEGGNAKLVIELMDGIENDDLPGREEDGIWQRAAQLREGVLCDSAKARCLELATQLRQLKAQNRWQDTLPALSEWELLRSQHKIVLPPDTEEDTAAVRKWATGLSSRRERTQERQRRWNELASRLDEMAGVPPAKKPRKAILGEIDELTAQSADLAAQANDGNGNTPPPDLVDRIKKESALLRQHLHRRKLQTAGLIFVSAVVAVALLAFGITAHLRNTRRHAALAAIEQHFKDGASGTLAGLLQAYDTDFGGVAPDETGAKLLSQARDFVQNHKAALERFNQELSKIQQAADHPPPAQIAGLLASLDDLEKDASNLGADDAQQAKGALQAVRLHLNQELTGNQGARTARLADILTRANQIMTEKLGGQVSADATQAAAMQGLKIIAEANDMASDPDLNTPAENATRTKLADLEKDFAAKATAARDALAARALLTKAHSLDDLVSALNALAPNALEGDSTVAAAQGLLAKKPDWGNVTQDILMPGDPQTWAFLANLTVARLAPAENNTRETVNFEHLAHNAVLGNTYRADRVTYADGVETGREHLYLAGKPETRELTPQGLREVDTSCKVILPDGTTPDQSMVWMQFAGMKPKGARLESVELAAESKLTVRLATAYDNATSSIREPLLRVLDDVRDDTESSPLLKAYLEQEILKVMQNRPRDWGLAFTATARKDAIEFTQITGGHLTAADWLFATSNSHLINDLKAFYTNTAGSSYYNEALTTLRDLLNKRAMTVRFTGFVDVDDAPHLGANAPADAVLWGISTAGTWQALFEIHNGKASPAAGSAVPARLTPLLFPVENETP